MAVEDFGKSDVGGVNKDAYENGEYDKSGDEFLEPIGYFESRLIV